MMDRMDISTGPTVLLTASNCKKHNEQLRLSDDDDDESDDNDLRAVFPSTVVFF